QVLENLPVLLDDEHDRKAAEREVDRGCGLASEVPLLGAVRRRRDVELLALQRHESGTDGAGVPVLVGAHLVLGVEAQQALVYAQLCLAPEVVVDAGENNDELVARVNRLGSESDVLSGLA